MQLPSTTSKQLEILKLIYRFRFLNTHHVQKILGHKDPRRIKAWLLDLTQKGFIRRIYSKEMGEHMKPAIYFLDKKGKSLLRRLRTDWQMWIDNRDNFTHVIMNKDGEVDLALLHLEQLLQVHKS